MTTSYDSTALWLKARLFINHAMDDEPRTFDEQAMWASLALELVAKAALARVSPLLIAVPSEEGTTLLMASGLVAGDDRFKTIPAASLYKRCQAAFTPFSLKEALAISEARNEYVHGARAVFSALPAEAWWPRYWAQARTLINASEKSIAEFVGEDRAPTVEAYLERNVKNLEHRVEMLIARAQQRLSQQQSGQLPARLAKEWATPADLTMQLGYREQAQCPACGGSGFLEGEHVESQEMRNEEIYEDEYAIWLDLTVSSDYFWCPSCRLILDSYELITKAGLDPSFVSTSDDLPPDEPEYGND